MWMHFPSDVVTKNSDANSVWNYYKYSSDVSAYMISVDDIQENGIAGNIMRLDYPTLLGGVEQLTIIGVFLYERSSQNQ